MQKVKKHIALWPGRLLVIACLVGGSIPAAAQEPELPANDPVFQVNNTKSDLRLVERYAKIVELENNIQTVYGFDEAVINVTVVEKSPNRVRVHAVSPGVTTLLLVDDQGTIFSIDTLVEGDVRHLQVQLNRLFPDASVKAVAVGEGSVVLRGWVPQPEQLNQIVDVAQRHYGEVLNHMQVGGLQQVRLDVKVMEVQRGKIRNFGFNFLYMNEDGFIHNAIGQLAPLTSFAAPFGGPPGALISAASLGNSSLIGAITSEDTVFQGFLEALKEESLLKILAEPKLTTTNGRPASMLAGGEFPILVPQSLGTATIEWREFGVRMEAVPIILGNGRVRLELQPEVSERDFTQSITTAGFTVPGITTRRVNTQVEMKFGETFMLAGLLSMRKTGTTQKIPVLGEIPWLGAAFRRVQYDEAETELVIMVTPYLVNALKPHEVPVHGPGMFTDSPTDRELHIDGLLEVPYYGDRCVGCETSVFPISGVNTSVKTLDNAFDQPVSSQPFGSEESLDSIGTPAPTTGPSMGPSTEKPDSLKDRLFGWTSRVFKPRSPRRPAGASPQANFRWRQTQSRQARRPQTRNRTGAVPPQTRRTQTGAATGSQTSSTSLSAPGRTRIGLIEPKEGLIQP